MDKIKEIADKADMIVNGYAFTRENNQIRILNLNNLEKALVISEDGSTILQKRGILNDREISKIQEYIKRHYKEMYIKWAEYSKNGFYQGN